MNKKTLRLGSHCGGKVLCRQGDPPQAENPAGGILFHSFAGSFLAGKYIFTIRVENEMGRENNLGTDDIRTLVFRLAIPSMLAQFVSVLYSIVDRMYIGNIAGYGEQALAAVGICGPIVTLLSSFSALIGIGGAPLFSIRMGSGNERAAKQIINSCFTMLLTVSFAVMLAAYLLKDWMISAFGAGGDIFVYADQYMTVYLAGTVFAIVSLGLNQFIICQGYANLGMLSVIIGAAANIVLDPIFIFVFKMGVPGAAWATILSQMCSCLFVLKVLTGRKIPVKIGFGLNWELCKKVLALGFTPFIIIAFDNVLIISLNVVLKKYGGANEDMLLTCATILQSFMLIITMPLGGITGGTQTILGYNYGARNKERVMKAQKEILKLALCFVTVMFIIAQFFSRYFIIIFTRNPEYIEMTERIIRLYTLGIIPLGAQYTIVDGFTGLGIAKIAFSLSFFRKFLYLSGVFLLPLFLDIGLVFAAEPISDIGGAAFSILIYCLTIKKILNRSASV